MRGACMVGYVSDFSRPQTDRYRLMPYGRTSFMEDESWCDVLQFEKHYPVVVVDLALARPSEKAWASITRVVGDKGIAIILASAPIPKFDGT